MLITLYKMNSPNNAIGKNKQEIKNVSGQIFEITDIDNPSFKIKFFDDIIKANYMYVPKFNRFYFIKATNIIDGNEVIIDTHIDVLETYKKEILNIQANVVRNEFKYNLNMKDNVIGNITEKTHKTVYLAKAPSEGFPFLSDPTPVGHCFVLNSL